MASIREQFVVAAPPDRVWAAVRDVSGAHRLFRGVLSDTRLDGDGARVVTFASGAVVRELIVDLDDGARRLAYSAVLGALGAEHHHATLQVHAAEGAQSQVVWVTDVLPHELAAPVRALMQQGAQAMRQTLEDVAGP